MRLLQLYFQLRARDSGSIPRFFGQTLRGGLMDVLRRLVCVARRNECADCLLKLQCPYCRLMEPFAPPDSALSRRYATLPRPFVIKVPFDMHSCKRVKGHTATMPRRREVMRGDVLRCGIVLLDVTAHFAPYIIYAMEQFCSRGLGGGRIKFTLERVDAVARDGRKRKVYEAGRSTVSIGDDVLIPITTLCSAPEGNLRTVTVRFATPVRLDLDGKLVFPITFHALIRGIIQRLHALQAVYYSDERFDVAFGMVTPSELLELARSVSACDDNQLWIDLERYSSRQKTRLKMGGAIGSVTFASTDACQSLSPFMPLLKLATWLHVGKLTAMGLGELEVVAHNTT
ncbi:MAG TPA: CRISPR system precrRNA processing endoribonuclease RAMP protein Cas6 [Armatimonadetes bacterium]|nr:CRISPR system precrRNA processing endoribonuclease RAMP protein Cas6 [Armatimonadota bacterium]